MEETWVWSRGQEYPLGKEMATSCSILAWRILMDREAWWARVHGAGKSQTQLKWLSMHARITEPPRGLNGKIQGNVSSRKHCQSAPQTVPPPRILQEQMEANCLDLFFHSLLHIQISLSSSAKLAPKRGHFCWGPVFSAFLFLASPLRV